MLKKQFKNTQNSVNPDWLAGLIDGDGGFYLSKSGFGACEITTEIADAHVLEHVRSEFGGRLKTRAGGTSIRFRAHNKHVLVPILHAVNGRLQNSIRRAQFEIVAQAYGLSVLPKQPFSWNNGYFSGFFDADGKITLGIKKMCSKTHQNTPKTEGKMQRLCLATSVQLTVGVTQKYVQNVNFLHTKDGLRFGRIAFDRSQNGYYTWYVSSASEVSQLCAHFENYPCLSSRKNRVALIPRLEALKSQTQTDAWRQFAQNWFQHKSS